MASVCHRFVSCNTTVIPARGNRMNLADNSETAEYEKSVTEHTNYEKGSGLAMKQAR